MKEHEKQIKELEKDLEEYVAYDEWSAREYGEYTVDCSYIAYKLIEQGWIKSDKDSVVLSREEFSKALTDNFNMGKKEAQFYSERVAIPTTRKETAEKIFTELLKEKQLIDFGCGDGTYEYIDVEDLKDLAKQFGVEIKE